jgi:hypothetical protein
VPFDLAAELHLKFDAVAVAYRKAMRALGLATSDPAGSGGSAARTATRCACRLLDACQHARYPSASRAKRYELDVNTSPGTSPHHAGTPLPAHESHCYARLARIQAGGSLSRPLVTRSTRRPPGGQTQHADCPFLRGHDHSERPLTDQNGS